MRVSRELLGKLLDNAGTAREKFLVLFVNDLDGRSVDFAKVNISNIDRSSGLLRLQRNSQHPERIKLSTATMFALQQYISHSKSANPLLIVDDDGKPQTTEDVRSILAKIAERAGLQFDSKTLRFRETRSYKGPRMATKTASKDMFYLYGIVSHPLRRKIIEVLGDEGPTGFKTLRDRADAKVGTLYYHLDMLKGLVSQDTQKRYLLTAAGRDAYAKLQSPQYVESTAVLVQNIPVKTGPLKKLARLLVLDSVWPALDSPSILPKAAAIATVGLGAFLAYQAKLETVLLFYNPVSSRSPLLFLEFAAAWLIIYGMADLTGTFLFQRKGEHLTLLLATGYALAPILAFAAWWNIVVSSSVQTPIFSTFTLSRILLILLQAWSLAMLARAVSIVKGLRLDRASVVSLAVAYVNILIAYIRGV